MTSAPAESGSWTRLEIETTILSDTHFGSGTGGAGIDALLTLDRDSRPVIHATHLTGVLREQATRLERDALAGRLFGSGGGQRRTALFSSLYAVAPTRSRVWRSSARESFDNRAPRDDTLRAAEFVPAGTVFRGQVDLPTADVASLQGLLREVDTLGSRRSANAGNARFTTREIAHTPADKKSVTGSGSRLLLFIQAVDPVCLAATATPGNIIPSEAFVPGRTLTGALASWLFENAGPCAAGTVTGDALSVGDAFPLPDHVDAALIDAGAFDLCPAPMSLVSEKPRGTMQSTAWWAGQVGTPQRVDRKLQDKGATRFKRPEGDLFVFRPARDSPWEAFRPARQVRLRNGRSNPKQVEPDLFAVEYIAERTVFAAEIRGEDASIDQLCRDLEPILTGRRWLRLGRGGAPAEVLRAVRLGERASEPPMGGPAYLTLTSDLLVRDDDLNWVTSLDGTPLQTILEAHVGTVHTAATHVITHTTAEPTVEAVAQDHGSVYGFNGTSRLWRNPATAIRRGSVFLINDPILSTALSETTRKGNSLGERTSEGFGRFRVDINLPGVTHPSESQQLDVAAPHPDDQIARTTREWAKNALSGHGDLPDLPTLTQWYGLVAELSGQTAGAEDPLQIRLTSPRLGKRIWNSPAAASLLTKLGTIPVDERAAYAKMLVRWLRAELKQRGEN